MKTLFPLLVLSCTMLVFGCGDMSASKPTGKTQEQQSPISSAATGEVFKKPNPSVAADDPRMIEAKKTSDAITQLLDAIYVRLLGLKKAYDEKAITEKDLKKVVKQLIPLAKSAREDCDAILRAAADLGTELKFAQNGYLHASELYRSRANTYTDPDLRKMTTMMADEFDRLAADVPKRIVILAEFLIQLKDMKVFLADTERCLHETEAALAILTAGPDSFKVSDKSKVFRTQLETFIAVVEKYQEKLLRPNSVPPIDKPKMDQPVPKPVGKAEVNSPKLRDPDTVTSIPLRSFSTLEKRTSEERTTISSPSASYKFSTSGIQKATSSSYYPGYVTTNIRPNRIASQSDIKPVPVSEGSTTKKLIQNAAPAAKQSLTTNIYFCSRCGLWHTTAASPSSTKAVGLLVPDARAMDSVPRVSSAISPGRIYPRRP